MSVFNKYWFKILFMVVALPICCVLLVTYMHLSGKVRSTIKEHRQQQLIEHVEENGAAVVFGDPVGAECNANSTELMVTANKETHWFPPCLSILVPEQDGILKIRVEGRVWYKLDSRRSYSDYETKYFKLRANAGQEVPLLINGGSVAYVTLIPLISFE